MVLIAKVIFMSIKKTLVALVVAVSFSSAQPFVVSSAYAAESEAQTNTEKKTRRTPALRAKVYTQLARAQKLADEGQIAEGLEALDNIQRKSSSMNSYERAMMWNFYAFIYYNQENYAKAVEYFDKLVNEENLPESLEQNTLFSMAQLFMILEDYSQTIAYIDRWAATQQGGMPAKANLIKAQAYYQLKDYQSSLTAISQAIAIEETAGNEVKESWYILQRADYYELNQTKDVVTVLEKLVRLFNKPEYWVQLGGMYGEIGEEEKQLAIMEAAQQQGYVTRKSDVKMLAQLYFYNGAPVKAANLMTHAMDKGVLDKDVKNLEFLAQAWSSSKDADKAIPVLVAAADIAQDGNFEQRLGEIFMNKDNYAEAVKYTQKAFEKGELKSQGNAYLVLGMAYFNMKQYDAAIEAFNGAKDVKESKRMASQWLAYVERTKKTTARL